MEAPQALADRVLWETIVHLGVLRPYLAQLARTVMFNLPQCVVLVLLDSFVHRGHLITQQTAAPRDTTAHKAPHSHYSIRVRLALTIRI